MRKKYSREELKEKLAAMLGVDLKLPQAPYYRQLRVVDKSGNFYSRYLLETEENMRVPMFLKDLQDGYYHIPELEKVELYIPHQDAKTEMMTLSAAEGARFFGLDYRGVGETCPDGCDQPEVRNFFTDYQFDYHYASLGLLLGESYLGGRVRDILSAIALLRQHGAREIVLRCSGIGRIPALFAALIADTGFAPDQALESCESACFDKLAPVPQSMLLRGFLELTDWDELEKMVR